MKVVGHQHIGVDGAGMRRGRLAEPQAEQRVVVGREEDRRAVVAALDEVKRLIGQKITRQPGHATLHDRGGKRRRVRRIMRV
jgi:hypothetical protein